MAGFEDLIRGALKKQGNPSPERREAIYASSRQALERMLANNTGLDPAVAQAQRDKLEKAIRDVDLEYVAGEAAAAPPPPSPQPTPSASVVPELPPELPRQTAPEDNYRLNQPATDNSANETPASAPPSRDIGAPERPQAVQLEPIPGAAPEVSTETPVRLEPEMSGAADEAPAHLRTYRGDALKEKKPYIKLLLWTIILVGIGVAGWWAVTFGPDMLKAKFQSLGSSETRTIDNGSFVADGDDNWVRVFSPEADATGVETNGRGTADLFDDNGTTFMRLASNPGSTRNVVRVRVPRGVMQTLQGQAATFEMVIKGAGELPQQFAVFCDFEEMGDCGRQRFKLRKQKDAFVFDVLVNDVALQSGEDAYLTFNTDLAATGKSLDLYSIRVRSGL